MKSECAVFLFFFARERTWRRETFDRKLRKVQVRKRNEERIGIGYEWALEGEGHHVTNPPPPAGREKRGKKDGSCPIKHLKIETLAR